MRMRSVRSKVIAGTIISTSNNGNIMNTKVCWLINPEGPVCVEGHPITLILLEGVEGGGVQGGWASNLLGAAVHASRDGDWSHFYLNCSSNIKVSPLARYSHVHTPTPSPCLWPQHIGTRRVDSCLYQFVTDSSCLLTNDLLNKDSPPASHLCYGYASSSNVVNICRVTPISRVKHRHFEGWSQLSRDVMARRLTFESRRS